MWVMKTQGKSTEDVSFRVKWWTGWVTVVIQ